MFLKLFGNKGSKISPDKAKLMMETEQGAILLDVRTPSEYYSMRIPGSVNLPLDSIDRISDIVKDKNKSIIIYCQSGARAASAVRALKKYGYSNIYNLGGIIAWPYKTVKGKA